MEDIFSFLGLFKAVWEKAGWWGVLGLVLSALVIFGCWEFCRSFIVAVFDRETNIGGFGGKLRAIFIGNPWPSAGKTEPKSLTKHNIFIRLKGLIEYQIPNMNIACKLRKKLFTDLLIANMEATRDCLLTFTEEMLTAPEGDLKSMFDLLFAKIERTWRANLEAKGYPDGAIKVFLRENAAANRHLKYLALDLLDSSSFPEGRDKAVVILDSIGSSVYTSIMNMEKALNNANGEVSCLTYQGLKCENCDPICKYSKNHLKAVRRIEAEVEAERTSRELKLLEDTGVMQKVKGDE